MLGKLRRSLTGYKQAKAYKKVMERWRAGGSILPPPHEVKRLGILECSKSRHVLVETGTYMGEMTEAMSGIFSAIHTFELSEEIYGTTKRRLSYLPSVQFHLGDSGKILGEVIAAIHNPITFWLDGHYSGGITAQGDIDTPVLAELTQIKNHALSEQHIILIDDARCFTGEGEFRDYPTIDQIDSWAQENLPNHRLTVEYDAIRLLPQK